MYQKVSIVWYMGAKMCDWRQSWKYFQSQSPPKIEIFQFIKTSYASFQSYCQLIYWLCLFVECKVKYHIYTIFSDIFYSMVFLQWKCFHWLNFQQQEFQHWFFSQRFQHFAVSVILFFSLFALNFKDRLCHF